MTACPTLNALRGFESAARLGSFSRAAEEQNLTQSAISHQVKALEEFFGQSLFLRVGRSVQLTDAGRDFLETASRTLQMLARGTRRLDAYLKPGSVIVTTSPAFASRWLLPRYAELASDHPGLQPWLYSTDEHEDLDNSELDIAVWRGDGTWPGLRVEKLFDDWLAPVCAPALLVDGDGTPEYGLAGHRLLHDERRPDWHDWFRLQGVVRTGVSEGFDFSCSGLLLDAAAAAQGVALGSMALANRQIAEGLLVRPFDDVMRAEDGYYISCMEASLRRPEVGRLWDWLLEQGSRFNRQLHARFDTASL